MGQVPNGIKFALILWNIWKWRYKKVFVDDFVLPSCLHSIIDNFLKDWMQVIARDHHIVKPHNLRIAWQPPTDGWVKLNIDGGRDMGLDFITAGGVARDANSKWLRGFTLKRGYGSVLEVELWDLFEGLQMVWNAGYKKVCVETNLALLLFC
ncbi:hypothetical protein ACOSP7_028381 [Xanthoceras sorbifolium]